MIRLHPQVGLSFALVASCAAASACTLEIVDTLVGTNASHADGSGAVDSGETGEGGSLDDGGGDEFSEGGEGNSSPELPLFDVGDGGEVQVSSCEFAAEFPSHIGCEFYGLDIDGPGLFDYEPFGFVIINPLLEPVEARLERYIGGSWTLVNSGLVDGEGHLVFSPVNNEAKGTGIHPSASLRITSEQPIIVVQAHPVTGTAISASATMLQPSTAWAADAPVAGWRTHEGVGERSFLGVISRTPGTTVTVAPTFGLANPPAQWADNWFDIGNDGSLELIMPVEPGELLRLDALAINAAEVDYGTSGSRVAANPEHLISLFSAHTCAAIPDYDGSCGHMQEQLSAALVGTRFVAPRLVASTNPEELLEPNPQAPLVHERTMIQVVATEPATEVRFSFMHNGAAALFDVVIIDPDQPYAVYVSDRDLAVVSDKPIIAAAYMTNPKLTKLGSPSMVQLAPVEQWTGHHWVWAPAGFETHLLVSASATASVEVEGLDPINPQPSATLLELSSVAQGGPEPGPEDDQNWAIRRFSVAPGIHRVESSGPASVVVAGWRSADGYAYLGGWGPSFADLGPEG